MSGGSGSGSTVLWVKVIWLLVDGGRYQGEREREILLHFTYEEGVNHHHHQQELTYHLLPDLLCAITSHHITSHHITSPYRLLDGNVGGMLCRDRARAVSSQVSDVQAIMQTNVGKMMENNQTVDDMQGKGSTSRCWYPMSHHHHHHHHHHCHCLPSAVLLSASNEVRKYVRILWCFSG